MALSPKAKIIIVAAFGCILTFVGVFMYFFMPVMIRVNITKKIALNNGSESYEAWEKTPLPITFQIYLFNVTNPDEILNGGKPAVEQLGPYGYLESREKYDIVLDDKNDTVNFRPTKTYVFNPDPLFTNGSLDDKVTMLNVPLLAIAKQAQYLSGFKKFMLNSIIQLYKAKPFVTRTAGQMMFEGYFDPLIEFLSKQEKRQILPNNTFGFFYGQNETGDGIYVIRRGNADINKFSTIVSYNNMTEMSYWGNEYCNMLNGTDGAQYPPFVSTKENLQMFVSEFCRSLYLGYEKEEILKGIRLLRFIPPPSLLAYSPINPDNDCFCGDVPCPKSGVMNISTCRSGAPIFISLPHFYQADPSFVEAVDGISPDPLLHETFISVEPYTGIVMNAAKRLQMNADLGPAKGIVGYGKMPEVILPMLWVYEGAELNDETADKFKRQLVTPMQLGTASTYAMIVVGVFMLVCLILYFVVKKCRRNSVDTLNVPNRVPDSVVKADNGPTRDKLLEENGHTVVA